ncbi:MAG: ribonuclease H-like domain-containing protein [Planctomycetota bacterium]
MNHDEQKQRIVLANNLASLDPSSDHEWDVYAQLRGIKELETKSGKPYLVLELADVHAVIEGKIWDNAAEAMAAAKAAAPGAFVKLRGKLKTWNGASQLIIERLKVVEEGESPEGFDPDQLIDPALAQVEDLACRTLVFDIETVPALDRRELPSTVAEALSDNAAKKEMDTAAVMGMSPFFGKVVSIAVGDGDAEPGSDADQVTVLAVPPEGFELDQILPDGKCPPWLRLMSEADLLRAFWALASKAECVVSYNGRGFDVPFVVTRSLIHGIPARVDLVSSRWSLKPHLDLFELVSQRGRGPSKLDVVCWALGIESPKGVMDGSMVAPAYERGEIVKIAEYNAHDVRATSAVYRQCRDMILRYRSDWTPNRS